MANIITCIRIFLSIFILKFPGFSLEFYTLYLICGFTDMLDGAIARKTNSTSDFGAKLDTFADFVFLIVCFVKMLPKLNLSARMWIFILLIGIFKIINTVWGMCRYKKIIVEHIFLNKITGVILFFVPILIRYIKISYIADAVCFIAAAAAVQEAYLIKKGYEVL